MLVVPAVYLVGPKVRSIVVNEPTGSRARKRVQPALNELSSTRWVQEIVHVLTRHQYPATFH